MNMTSHSPLSQTIAVLDAEHASDEWTDEDMELIIVNRFSPLELGLPTNLGESMREAVRTAVNHGQV